MRKIVVSSCIFLIVSGILLSYQEFIPYIQDSSIVSLLHIWTGMFFIVIFPMYSWDHIRMHKERLWQFSWVSWSGIIQLTAGSWLILSGVVLLLYGVGELVFFTNSHFLLTFVFVVSLLIHTISKK